MTDTVRSLSALQTLLADNTTGDISPQDLRDFLVTAYYSWGRYEDLAYGQAYTLSASPSTSYPDYTIIYNGSEQAGILTSWPTSRAEELGFTAGYLGWRLGTELAGDSGYLTVHFDFGADVTVVEGRAAGTFDSSQQLPHPEEFIVEYSSNDSTWYTFGTSLTGMSYNPDSATVARWLLSIADDPTTARYWRIRILGGDMPSGDDWLFVGQIQLMGFE